MTSLLLKKYLNQWTIGIILLVIFAIIVLLSVFGIPPPASCPVFACSVDCSTGLTTLPVFPAPLDKIADLRDPSFTGQLYKEALVTEPRLAVPGTQVHMGFWSGR